MQYCMNCGAQMAPGARFCPGCGAHVNAEASRHASEETFVRPVHQPQAVMPTPRPFEQPVAPPPPVRSKPGEERVIFSIRPTLLFIKIGYVLAALGGLLLVAFLSWLDVGIPYWISLPIALALLLLPAYHHIRRNLVKYTLTDSKIEIDEGFF